MDGIMWEKIFGIAHWWGRFEFTPGRGQIHIHFLAIRKNQNILRLCHDILKQQHGKQQRDQLLADWCQQHFGLTATVQDEFDSMTIQSNESPCRIRLSDIPYDEETLSQDIQQLMKFCQVHECNGFCLRKKQSNQ